MAAVSTAWVSSRWFWPVSGIAIVVLVFISMDPGLSIYDEALVLYGAFNVLRGEFPYRDFWSFYGPGQYYVLAALFHLFGVYAFLGRLWYAATVLATLLGVIKLQSLISGRRLLGACAAIISLVWISIAGMYLYPIYPALAFALLAAICMVRHWQSGLKGWLCLAGALIAVVILFRHDLAAYLFVSLSVGECFHHLKGDAKAIRYRWRTLLGHLSVFCACIIAVALPVILLLLQHIPFADISYQMFYIPSHVYPEMRHIPWFDFDKIALGMARVRYAVTQSIVLMPIGTSIVAIACLLQKEWRSRQEHWQVSSYVMLTCLVLTLPVSGVVRPDIIHLIAIPIFESLLLACLMGTLHFSARYARVLIVGATIWLGFATIVPTWRMARQIKSTLPLLVRPAKSGSIASLCRPPAGLERITCMRIDPVEEEEVEYIQQHTGPDAKVYSGVGRHDKIGMNDILFYFVSKRDAPTKWYYLEPGLQTTYPIQKQMIEDLDRQHVNYVIRNLTWDNDSEPNQSRFSSGVTILDQYIDSNYKTVATFPQVLILRRITPF